MGFAPRIAYKATSHTKDGSGDPPPPRSWGEGALRARPSRQIPASLRSLGLFVLLGPPAHLERFTASALLSTRVVHSW